MAQPAGHSDLEVGGSPQLSREAYSTLQVQPAHLSLTDTQKQLAYDPQKQWAHDPQKQWAHDPQKELARHFDPYGASAPETVDYNAPPSHLSKPNTPPNRTILGLRRRTFWIALVLSLVVVAAIVGGAVGGTVGKGQNSDEASSPASIPSDSEPATAAPLPPSASRLLDSTTIASLGWNDTQGILQQRLYIQASDNNIWELAWNATTAAWFTSSESLGQAKSGSPLAAAVAYEGRTDHVKLYYININGELMQTNTTDFKQWDTNPVTNSTGAVIKPANDSSLAATWYNYPPCPDCSYNAFVAYQSAETGGFEVVNASTSGEMQYTTLPTNPLSGSTCHFNLMWRSNQIAFLRLSYQLAGGQPASAIWNGMYHSRPHEGANEPNIVSSSTGTYNVWQSNEKPEENVQFSIVAPGAPSTSFNFGRGAPTDVPDYLFVLSAGENGVTIDWWDNSDPSSARWGTPQSPAAMRGVRSLSPITANGAGHVFAFEGSVVKEYAVEADGTTWDLVGDVTRS
ncbi:MAG: hypothetical protein LQ348_007583 [Seirophora lacunosa]|nr:MAG: hypothetical protein LQ348_007583 [Seirophora lacunosa]